MNLTWNLKNLYPGFEDPAFEADFARVDTLLLAALDALKLPDDAAALEGFLTAFGEADSVFSRLGNLTQLTLATDAENETALAVLDRLMKLEVRVRRAYEAATRRVGAMAQLPEGSPVLAEHAYFARCMREDAAHALDEAIEAPVLQMQMTGGRAFSNLRDLLDATQVVPVEMDGAVQALSLSQARNLAYHADAAVRKAAYDAELAAYPRMEHAMAACLSAIKGEALTLCELRRYDDPLDVARQEAHISRKTLDALMTAIRESLPMFRRYLRAKGAALGHADGLPFCDLFAPMGEAGQRFTPETCRDLLVDTVGAFDPAMRRLIEDMIDGARVDWLPHTGKQGGAFCSGVYAIGKSFVLANFDGALSDVLTLAHELGHAFHDHLLFENPPLIAEAPMTLAETASIFNETLLTGYLLDHADEKTRLNLIDQALQDATQTIVDIYSRYLFETEIFKRRREHSLSAKEFCEIMRWAQGEAYGDGLDPNALHPYMWACKSHYYSPDIHFYNFPYAFGLLFGRGMYARYRREGASFVPAYKALLGATGRMSAEDAARGVGIELEDAAFWRESIRGLGELADQFEALVSKR